MRRASTASRARKSPKTSSGMGTLAKLAARGLAVRAETAGRRARARRRGLADRDGQLALDELHLADLRRLVRLANALRLVCHRGPSSTTRSSELIACV